MFAFLSVFLQNLWEQRQKCHCSGGGSEQVRDCLCQEYGHQLILKEYWQDKNQWYHQDQLAEAGKEQGGFCLAERKESLLAGNLRPHAEKARKVNPHRPACHIIQFLGAAVEDSDKGAGKGHDNAPGGYHKGQAAADQQPEGAPDAGIVPCAIIVTDNRLRPLGQAA